MSNDLHAISLSEEMFHNDDHKLTFLLQAISNIKGLLQRNEQKIHVIAYPGRMGVVKVPRTSANRIEYTAKEIQSRPKTNSLFSFTFTNQWFYSHYYGSNLIVLLTNLLFIFQWPKHHLAGVLLNWSLKSYFCADFHILPQCEFSNSFLVKGMLFSFLVILIKYLFREVKKHNRDCFVAKKSDSRSALIWKKSNSVGIAVGQDMERE